MLPNAITPKVRFSLLEPMRGIAALWVFAFHYEFSNTITKSTPWLHSIFKAGSLGVPMFFVISGFCLGAAASQTKPTRQGIVEFTKRRFFRIFPPFWCSIVVAAALPFALESLSSLRTGVYIHPSAAIPSNGFLNYDMVDWILVGSLGQVFRAIPDAATLQSKFSSINAVYWTLAIEVQFYIVVAIGILTRRFNIAMSNVFIASIA